MRDFWSQYVQTTGELYRSRSLRFHDGNKELWLRAIGAKCGDHVLEVGCAGGAFCHRLLQYRPGIQMTGLDRDAGHIAFAREKTRALGLHCDFVNADATAMPFADRTFDVCFSHTVAEHVPHEPFFGEQFRVLKPGGRISVLSVRSRLGVKENGAPISAAEQALIEKAWNGSDRFPGSETIGTFEMDEHQYPRELEKAGFVHVNVSLFTVMDYAPDNASVSDTLAIEQIECRRLSNIDAVRKALHINPCALSQAEQFELLTLINARFDKRIAQYHAGERLWDFSSITVLVAEGIKPC